MVITLTTVAGLSIALDDSQIIYVQASGVSNSIVTFYNFGNALEKITVTSTPAAIASASGAVMSVTQYVTGYSGTTQTTYINALKCSRSITDFTSYRAIQYNEFGNSWKPIYVTDSLANLVAAINVTSSPEVTIAGAQTITGQKTFSAAVLVSAVTDATTKDTGSIITEGGIGVEKAIVAGTSITAGTRMITGAGLVTAPGLVVGANDNGIYEVSSTQQGFSIGNTLVGGFNSTGVFADVISEQTSTLGVTVDSVLLKDGGVSNSAATFFTPFIPTAAQQALSGAGAIAVTNYLTAWTSTGTGDALTLANSTQIGQLKKVTYVAAGAVPDTGVISLTGYTSITLNAIGDYVTLMWNGSAWFVIENVGATIV